ncbi:hypothetical protein [Clostridium formicaceticum]|nr:hypothetical protein [Clostridium formicaceticum]
MALSSTKQRSDRLKNALLFGIESFRKGDDHVALDSFLDSMDDLEKLLENHQCIETLNKKMEKLLPVLQTLYEAVKSQDVIAMTDILAFTLYPLIEGWEKECDEK